MSETTTVVMSPPVVDYARFVIRGDVDLVLQKVEHLTSRFDAVIQGGQGLKGDCKSYPVPGTATKPGGRVWECWGTATQFVWGLDFKAWYLHLSRLDIRREVDGLDVLGLDVIYQYFRAGSNARTVHRYHSPARQKRSGRNAGGDSFAVGSHKSDMRATWYIHRGQPCAYEVQCQHDMLRHGAELAYKLHKEEGDAFAMWEFLVQWVLATWTARLQSAAGATEVSVLRAAVDARADTLLMGITADNTPEPQPAHGL